MTDPIAFSSFIRSATEREKRAVYMAVMDAAGAEQRRVIQDAEIVSAKRSRKSGDNDKGTRKKPARNPHET